MDTSILSYVTPIILFFGLVIAVRQLILIRQSYRFNTAPFITFEIEASNNRNPFSDPALEEHLIEAGEFEAWAKAKPRARHRYMILKLKNKQTHIAGAAIDVCFRIVFRIPQYGTPNTMIEVAYKVEGEIFMEPEEIYRFLFADLKGIDTAVIDIDQIVYYDVDNNKYKRSYGFCHWELDNKGEESWDFRAC